MTNLSSAVQARTCTHDASPGLAAGDARTNTAKSMPMAADLDELVRGYIRSVLKGGFLTRQDLAHYSGLSRSGLTQWLNGQRTMKLENASRLVSLFGLERFVQYLVHQGRNEGNGIRQPDLLTLLQQLNIVLQNLVERTLGIRVERDEVKEGGVDVK